MLTSEKTTNVVTDSTGYEIYTPRPLDLTSDRSTRKILFTDVRGLFPKVSANSRLIQRKPRQSKNCQKHLLNTCP